MQVGSGVIKALDTPALPYQLNGSALSTRCSSHPGWWRMRCAVPSGVALPALWGHR